MSTPNRSNASSASSSRSRPTPVIPKASSAKSSASSLNGPIGQPLTVDSDSSGGRRHTPSSVARTKFTPQSLPSDVAAMQKLKQKMTFSNQSSRTSSADNTPEKKVVLKSDSTSKRSTHTPSSAARFVPVGDERYSGYASEGEITSSVSISAILSKLDSLKGYLKEAESLRDQLQQKISEPGVVSQLEKLNKLIAELQQQESSYLAVLLQIMDRDNAGSGDYSQSDDYSEDSDDEESEEGASEGDTPVNQSSRRPVGEGGAGDEAVGDQALSLRAQMEQQKHLDEEEELAVLMEQQKMLKQLLEQQKQIKELESKQASLLRMKQSAQQQILEAETKSMELQRLKSEAERLQQERQMKESSAASEQLETAMQELDLSESGREELDPVEEERKQQLMSQLTELKARKEQLDQMMSVLSAIRAEEERQSQASVDDKEEVVEKQVPKLEPASQPRLSKSPPRSAVVQDTSYNVAELVAENDLVPGMEHLQAKLRMAEEAKKKLSELQTMIGRLQESDRDDESGGVNTSGDHKRLAWRHSLQPTQHSGRGIKSPSKDDDGQGDTSLNSTLTATESPATQSAIGEYQQRLILKKQEMIELQRERDELQKTRDRLLKHYQNLGQSEGEEEEEVGTEVERQKLLYDELVKKTRELQQLRMLNADAQRATKQGAPYSSADVTGATWGGSTVQSELDDADTTASTISGHVLDTTQDSVEPTAIGGSASLEHLGGNVSEKPKFSVTRHTPRQPARTRPHIRVDLSPADEQMGKRIKLDSEDQASKVASAVPKKKESAHNAKPSTVSAVWPGVIFPSYYRKSSKEKQAQRDESTQTQVRPTTIAGQSQNGVHHNSDREAHYAYLLQSQLAVMSNMCGELLHSQNGLIHIMCNRMESGVQEHMAMLQLYQRELEQYYLELYQSYAQIAQHKDDNEQDPTQAVEGSDTEDPVTAPSGGATKHTVSVSTAQEEPTDSSIPNIPTASEENELPTTAQERIPTLDSYYRPPPTLYNRPNYYHYGGGRPMTPRNYNFGPGSSAPWSQPREPFTGPGLGFSGPGYSYMSSHDGGARPTGSYEPGDYQPTGSLSGVKDDADNPLDSTIPPPPMPPTLGSSYYQSPYNYRPPTAPGGKRGAAWNSPLGYPPVYPPSGSYLQGSPLGGYGQWPYPTPMGFTPHSAHNPAASFLGHPPHLDSYPPFVPVLFPQMSMDAAQVHSVLPTQSEEDPMLRFDPSLGLRSPSGITATSLQVQPPSSPPSAQSVNLQPGSSSNFKNDASNINNTHGIASLATSVGQTGLLQTTKTTQTGFSYLQPRASSLTNATGDVSGMARDGVVKSKHERTQLRQPLQDEESESSIPLSIPEEIGAQLMEGGRLQVPGGVGGGGLSSDPPADFSVFDALRDTIYSEVATLIANNEARPHFLVELFRELQMLTTDYLRQRALYSMQELVTKYLTEDGVAKEAKAASLFQNWVGSASEHTPSESGATTEDEVLKQLPPPSSAVTQGFDYVEPINSASSISTPLVGSSMLDDPFASDNLGNTVIRMDKAMTRLRAQQQSAGVQTPSLGAGPLAREGGDLVSESSQSDTTYPDLDTQLLDEEIKAVMTEVIPILKENLNEDFSTEYLTQIKEVVMKMVTEQQKSQKRDLFEMFVKQLDSAITSTLEKYLNQKLKDCGEDLLVDTSEVLFNELAFFRLMQDIKGHPQLVGDFKSMTSQTTTENEEEGDDDSDHDETTAVRASVRVGSSATVVVQPTNISGSSTQQPLDPAVLQVLSAVANVTLMEEEEALGKSRDDDLATSWDTKQRESSMSADEELGGVFKVELAVSESQPIESVGSSEDDETTPFLPTHPTTTLTGSDSKEHTPVPVEQQQPPKSSVEETTKTQQDLFREEDRIATPPTPLAAEPSDTAASTIEDEGNKQEMGGVEKIKGLVDSGGIAINDQQVGQVLSSDGLVATGLVVPAISSITQEALEAQMKVEQQANDGIAEILTTIEDQGQEIAGGGDDNITSLDSAEP